ncbi:coatomer subunit alpha [Anaeramoeba flamelloides]|uniref:Coatomer subunit alpha n=1 Tax=Anaeramoeba flamelloides TaxID=1746091 RepID=A0ABQ8X5A1_9EUKA|nr:coatomer subunit alpha [Anaeramoeba flamelloides]
MFTKSLVKSKRVKSISFHPKEPMVAIGLHNGGIRLFNYESNKLLKEYNDHEGAVRGVDFHISEPFFVSGGDDKIVRVWSYESHQIKYFLEGHSDYIRCVQFHKEYTWLLSCSDDMTLRLWDYPEERCISVITGHENFVMNLSFHPTQDLIISVSLDKSIRIWDYSSLEDRPLIKDANDGLHGSVTDSQDQEKWKEKEKGKGKGGIRSKFLNFNMFQMFDIIPKFVLEHHEDGINWGCFHPTQSLIASASDDHTIKIWQISEEKAWLVTTLSGHTDSVASVVFDHFDKDTLISNSEDGTMKIWSLSKQKCIKTIHDISPDKFWCLAHHPTAPLYACGHDNGTILFKLRKTKTPIVETKNGVVYISDMVIKEFNLKNHETTTLLNLKKRSSFSFVDQLSVSSKSDAYALISEENFEVFYKANYGDTKYLKYVGTGKDLFFLSPTRVVFLSEEGNISIKQLNEEKRIRIFKQKETLYSRIFSSYPGTILVYYSGKLGILDLEQKIIAKKITVEELKNVVWSKDKQYLALVCKREIVICNRKLKKMTSIEENQKKIKSARWGNINAIFYTTKSQLKYLLLNGESGTVKTLENSPCFIGKIHNNNIIYFDQNQKMYVTKIKSNDYLLKIALEEKKTGQINKLMKETKFPGHSMARYLKNKGYPNIALPLVKDPKIKFDLAILSNDLEVAFSLAKRLDNEIYWKRLATVAMKNGNIDLVEKCYQRSKDFGKLSFLYLISGNTENLNKIYKICQNKNLPNLIFQNSLFLNSIEERIEMLIQNGRTSLAYLLANNNGLLELAEKIKNEYLNNDEKKIQNLLKFQEQKKQESNLLLTPTPIIKNTNNDKNKNQNQNNWPLLRIERESKINLSMDSNLNEQTIEKAQGGWGMDGMDNLDDLQFGLDFEVSNNNNNDNDDDNTEEPQGGGGGGWDTDLNLENLIPEDELKELNSSLTKNKETSGFGNDLFIPPRHGKSHSEKLLETSEIPVEFIASGQFDIAMKLLNRQIGITNFKPLKDIFLKIYLSSNNTLKHFPLIKSISNPIIKKNKKKTMRTISPTDLEFLENDLLQNAYGAASKGNFSLALENFRNILFLIPFLIIEKREEQQHVYQLIKICKEYINGFSLEMERKKVQNEKSQIRLLEMAAYFTHCELQQTHLTLALRSAMLLSLKIGNHINALSFAKRLLEISTIKSFSEQAKKLIPYCKKNLSNKIEIDYDERNPFVICSYSYTPIYKGSEKIQCPYCNADYLPKYLNQICNVCKLSKIGLQCDGLTILKTPQKFKK